MGSTKALALALAVGLLPLACGGSEFDDATASAGSGGAAAQGGSGGSGAGAGGAGGAAGSAGASAGGAGGASAGAGPGGAAGGPAGAGGVADAGPGDASVEASGPPEIEILQATRVAVSGDPAPVLSLDAPTAAGSAVIVGITCISDFQGDCVIADAGVTDDRGNAYTRVVQGEALLSSSQGARGYVFIAEGVAAGATSVRVDPEGDTANQRVVWGAIEVAGLAPAPCLDAWGSSLVGSGTSTLAVTDLPTAHPNELAVSVFSMRSDDTNMLITAESGWTVHQAQQNGASGPPGHAMISRILEGTGVVSHQWTHDAPTRSAAAVIATFAGATQP